MIWFNILFGEKMKKNHICASFDLAFPKINLTLCSVHAFVSAIFNCTTLPLHIILFLRMNKMFFVCVCLFQ